MYQSGAEPAGWSNPTHGGILMDACVARYRPRGVRIATRVLTRQASPGLAAYSSCGRPGRVADFAAVGRGVVDVVVLPLAGERARAAAYRRSRCREPACSPGRRCRSPAVRGRRRRCGAEAPVHPAGSCDRAVRLAGCGAVALQHRSAPWTASQSRSAVHTPQHWHGRRPAGRRRDRSSRPARRGRWRPRRSAKLPSGAVHRLVGAGVVGRARVGPREGTVDLTREREVAGGEEAALRGSRNPHRGRSSRSARAVRDAVAARRPSVTGSQKKPGAAAQSDCWVHGVTHTDGAPGTTGMHTAETHSAFPVHAVPRPRPGGDDASDAAAGASSPASAAPSAGASGPASPATIASGPDSLAVASPVASADAASPGDPSTAPSALESPAAASVAPSSGAALVASSDPASTAAVASGPACSASSLPPQVASVDPSVGPSLGDDEEPPQATRKQVSPAAA